MFSIFRQSGFFFYRNYLYFLPAIGVFTALAGLVMQPQLPEGSEFSAAELMDFYMDSNFFLLPLVYLFGFPFVVTIAHRRINYQQESVADCMVSSLRSCWRAVLGLVQVVLILGGMIYLLLLLLSLLQGVNVAVIHFALMGLSIYLMLRLSLLLPALVEDRLPAYKAIAKSFIATRGRTLMVLGAYTLSIAIGIAALIVVNPVSTMIGTQIGKVLGMLVDIHLNILLLIVFYRMYLLDKTGEIGEENQEVQEPK